MSFPSDDHAVDELAALPPHIREEIDLAFDRALEPEEDARTRRRKRRRLHRPPSPTPGGFLADDSPGGFIVDEDTGGGFLPASSSSPGPSALPSPRLSSRTHIPLSAIPTALKLLKLPPDDEEVLATFNEAATGWGKDTGEGDEEGVSREDWRAVCAVLLAQRDEEAGMPMEEDEALDEGFADSDDEGDVWKPQGADYDDEDEDEPSEYEDEPTTSAHRKGKGRLSPPSISRITFADLNSSQKRECRDAFELFLDPDENAGPGSSRRINGRDLVRVAKLLNEKLSDTQINEMLGLFSDSPDKSLGVEEFSRIMIEARMI